MNDAPGDIDETRLAAVVQRLHDVHVSRSHIGDQPAQRDTTRSQAASKEPLAPAIVIGPLRVAFGDPHGARIDAKTSLGTKYSVPRQTEPRSDLPAVVVRAASEAAIWDAFTAGASVVQIDGGPGAGASTLLGVLAAGAHVNGFANGAFLATDVCGPADDAAQQIAALIDRSQGSRYYTASDLAGLSNDLRSLILLDRATLTPADIAKLRECFPTCCFVVADVLALPQTPTVVLGPLDAQAVLTLLEASYGRPVDVDNRRPALEICATVGSLPGPSRLIGVAARRLQRSFISLQVEFESGHGIIRHFLASLPPAERYTLGILAAVGSPLAAHHIAYVVRNGDIHSCLENLIACEFVRADSPGMFEVPRSVALLVPPFDDDAAFGRVVDVLCDVFDSWPAVPVLDRQLAAAEQFIRGASERSRWAHVLAIGPRLAEMFAIRGAFGAWGRVLGVVESAATQLGDKTALCRTRHDLGVRAILLGDDENATRYLQSAAGDRKTAGDDAGAIASATVLELAAIPLPAPEIAARPVPASELPVEPKKPRAAWALMLFGLSTVAAATVGFLFPHRPGAGPTIAQFSSRSLSFNRGRSVELCIDATDSAVVEIFPNGARLPGTGKHCLIVHPAGTTTYVAVATAADGRQTRRAVTVGGDDLGVSRLNIAAFSASPARIKVGQSTRLCYAVTGAHFLRIVPRVADLTRLRACHTVTLGQPHRYGYTLSATGEDGQVAVRHVHVDVVASSAPSPRTAVRSALDERLTRRAIYQFDATPRVVERGQATSLCVGVERSARGFVTHVGALESGITRCYRVQPQSTTVYRLYVALRHSTAVETVTVTIRPSARRREVARDDHR